jgi:Tetratricopeptide repeat
VAIRINNLGSALQDLGDVAGARAYFARALSIFEKFLPTDHPHVTKTRSHLQIIAEEQAARAKE